jgi:hypothetical protein
MFATYNPSRRPAASVKGRKVFENSMVAHVWAQQSQSEGRSNNGQFYFRDSTIYSYGSHFPIAQFSRDKSVVWFTQRGYSVTTARHISYTQDALRGLNVHVISVPDLSRFVETNISKEERAAIEETLLRADRETAWQAFQRVAGTLRRKWPSDAQARIAELDAKRANAALAEKLSDARHVIDMESIGISRAFIPAISNEKPDSEWPTPYYVATDTASRLEALRAKIMSARAVLSKQANKSKADQKRIKAASRVGADVVRLRDVWRNIVAAMEASRDYQRDRETIATALANIASGARCDYWYERGVGANHTTETEILSAHIRRALRADYTPAEIAPLWEVLQARLFYRETDNATPESIAIVNARRYGRKPLSADDWRNGAGDTYQYGFAETLLRRKADTLQTSRGAECPFAHAVIAFRKAQECRANGTTWQRNGQQIRVGVFNVDSIDAQGNMRAGCHSLKWEEMERLAIREIPNVVKPRFGLPALINS